MSCVNIKYIQDYLDNALDVEVRIGFDKHLKKCSECSRLVKVLRAMPRLPKLDPARNIAEAVMKRAEADGRPRSGALFSFFSVLANPFAVPLATMLIIFAVLLINYPRQQKLTKVFFNIQMEDANSVALAGDFNGWDPLQGQLHRQGNYWVGSFKVEAGRYQYMLIVDGNKWMPDPYAVEYVEDGYGNRNSLLDTTKI